MRIDGIRLGAIKPEMSEMLKNLEVGDTIKGRVMEVIGSSIAIRIAGGQILTALLQEGVSMPKGALVELTVNSLIEGKIFAEFKYDSSNTDMDAKVSRLLGQLNLPVDEKSVEAAKLLIKYNLPVEKEAIVNITGLQKSIESLNRSSEGRIGLLLSGMDIKNTPVDILNKIVLTWSPDMIKPEEHAGSELQTMGTPAAVFEADEGTETFSNMKVNIYRTSDDEVVKEQLPVSTKELPDVRKTSNADDKAAPSVGKAVSAGLQEVVAAKSGSGADLINVLEKLGIETGSTIKSFAGQVTDILSAIKNADMESVAYLLSKEMDATPRNLGILVRNLENTDGISQFLEKLQQKLQVDNDPKLVEIKESIKKVFLEPKQVENLEEVNEQIKDIVKLGERLESFLESSGRKDPDIREALSNLRDNLDFIRSINEHNNFIHLPLMINGDASTAKLYVFREGKGSKEIDTDNATVLVALDLKSLGHVESMIGIKGKTVNLTFRVENSDIRALIDKHSDILKKALKEKGYSLGPIRTVSLEQPFSLISLEELINKGRTGKIHFDTRI